MHADHIGGLTLDGRAVFPKAVVRADAREAAHYLSRERLAKAGAEKPDLENAIAMLDPYVQSQRFPAVSTARSSWCRACGRCRHAATRRGNTTYVRRERRRNGSCCGATWSTSRRSSCRCRRR
jgi:hypothetical protein